MHTSATETHAEHDYQPPKPWLVTVALLSAFVVFGVCMTILIYRGFTSEDPRSVIMVVGNDKWKGATVTVEGGNLKNPLVAFIQDYNKYQVPFFVGRGSFVVRVERGSFLATDSVVLDKDNMLASWSLPVNGPATQKRP